MTRRLKEIDRAIEALTTAQARRKQLTAQMDELDGARGWGHLGYAGRRIVCDHGQA